MKIVIAALASLAFGTSAIAAVPSVPVKQSVVKIAGQIELAHGESRGLTATTRNAPSAKGAAQTGGKTMSGKK